jgi:hypothetical protein
MAIPPLLIAAALLLGADQCRAQSSTPLPCRFEHGLITLLVPQSCSDTLRFYLDTGGLDALYRSGNQKRCKNGTRMRDWSDTIVSRSRANGIPWPSGLALQRTKERDGSWDGMLGRAWFGEGRWAFDHPAGTLAQAPNDNSAYRSTVALGKREHPTHGTTGPLLRIPVMVSGDTIQLLFDTGARMQDDRGEMSATSFISDSLFNHWHVEHPEWVVVPAKDHSLGSPADQIFVPEVIIGTRTIGPVVFTVRAKENFHVLSRHFMDRPVVGALGANALSLLGAFILDYPGALLMMEP